MSRRVIWTPRPAGRSWRSSSELHRDGQTIVLVTHEQYVAQRAQRVVRLADGVLQAAEHWTSLPTVDGHA